MAPDESEALEAALQFVFRVFDSSKHYTGYARNENISLIGWASKYEQWRLFDLFMCNEYVSGDIRKICEYENHVFEHIMDRCTYMISGSALHFLTNAFLGALMSGKDVHHCITILCRRSVKSTVISILLETLLHTKQHIFISCCLATAAGKLLSSTCSSTTRHTQKLPFGTRETTDLLSILSEYHPDTLNMGYIDFGEFPVHDLCGSEAKRRENVIRILVETMIDTANLCSTNSYRSTALQSAIRNATGSSISMIFNTAPRAVYICDSNKNYPIHSAVRRGNFRIFSMIMEATPDTIAMSLNSDGQSAFTLACAAHRGGKMMEAFIHKYGAEICATVSHGGNSPLSMACKSPSFAESIGVLVDNFSNEELWARGSKNPLMPLCASKRKNNQDLRMRMIHAILSRRPNHDQNPVITQYPKNTKTPLQQAFDDGNVYLIGLLLANVSKSEFSANQEQCYQFLCDSIRTENSEIIRLTLSHIPRYPSIEKARGTPQSILTRLKREDLIYRHFVCITKGAHS